MAAADVDDTYGDDSDEFDLAGCFPAEVEDALAQVLPSDDPFDDPNFNVIDHINTIFSNEQSLSNLDDVICKTDLKIRTIDDDISAVIRGQSDFHHEGRIALEQAQKLIRQLYSQVKEIKVQAEKSEEMVREITCDIKSLDTAKRNLTMAVTTLNHLHMLVEGIETLRKLTDKRLYSEILNPLQALNQVMTHFKDYNDIAQIQQLSQQVRQIQVTLAQQITSDFHETFSNTNVKGLITKKQLSEACHIVSILDEKVKRDLLKWFVHLQLQEYIHLFADNQDTAWLDKIDKRYAWIKRHLLDFEEKLGAVFPADWNVSECIALEFCRITRDDLTKIMTKRRGEIDVKILLYAIQRTTNFEKLLARRFGDDADESSNFHAIISVCFEAFLNIFVESVSRNLVDLIARFVLDAKQTFPSGAVSVVDDGSLILPSCADLFIFYKKCTVQCVELSCGEPLLELAQVFKKYLREYAEKLLQNNLPKNQSPVASSTILASSMSSLTKDLQNLSTVTSKGLIQNFSNLLKEGDDAKRFTRDELLRICCILTSAEYCLETTQQLEDKLKKNIDARLTSQITFADEQDVFHNIISTCIHILVQDLEAACEPALNAMVKMQWQNVDSVGDQSAYVTMITSQLKQTIILLRDNLTANVTNETDVTTSSRKYFTQFCIKFATSFIQKFVTNIYKCKPISPVGAEQLLLDTHSLKTVLSDLPQIGSVVNRKTSTAYTKIVHKGMTKAEMLLKLVMTQLHPSDSFIDQYLKLIAEPQLNEFQKILDMKGVKRNDQFHIIDMFKQRCVNFNANETDEYADEANREGGRIRKLEKLIKKRIA